jgi:hypothetical protein
MADAEKIVRSLASAAKRRQDAEARAAHYRSLTDELVLAGHAAGVPKLVLAREAGLTRQTVYGIILRAEASASAAA